MEDFKTHSDVITDLIAALIKVQAVVETASKDNFNPHFKSKYADLTSIWDVCRLPLCANGLAITQLVEGTKEAMYLTTWLMHASGQWMRSRIPLLPEKSGPQAQGSAITYARRYALAAIVGICSDDDDGEKAQGRTNAKDKVEKQKVEGIKDDPDTEARFQTFLSSFEKEEHPYIREFFTKYSKHQQQRLSLSLDDYADLAKFDKHFRAWKQQHYGAKEKAA